MRPGLLLDGFLKNEFYQFVLCDKTKRRKNGNLKIKYGISFKMWIFTSRKLFRSLLILSPSLSFLLQKPKSTLFWLAKKMKLQKYLKTGLKEECFANCVLMILLLLICFRKLLTLLQSFYLLKICSNVIVKDWNVKIDLLLNN